METLHPDIRNTVRAVIIRDDHILLLKKQDDIQGTRYALPGGAQETGETLTEAVQRECLEEIDVSVELGEIIHIADFFKQRSQPEPHVRQQLEILFQGRIPASYTPKMGTKPDKHQVAVEWYALDQLPNCNLSPAYLSEVLTKSAHTPQNIYLGKFG